MKKDDMGRGVMKHCGRGMGGTKAAPKHLMPGGKVKMPAKKMGKGG